MLDNKAYILIQFHSKEEINMSAYMYTLCTRFPNKQSVLEAPERH